MVNSGRLSSNTNDKILGLNLNYQCSKIEIENNDYVFNEKNSSVSGKFIASIRAGN